MTSGQPVSRETVRFSVVIPAFNSARTLARAIDSVLLQTWPAHEIIVVDDGSGDDTATVAQAYGDRIVLVQQSNAGVSAARNKGAEIASGNWLAFLDADDWYLPDRLRWHAEWIAEDPSLDFLTGDYEYRDEEGALLGTSMSGHLSGRQMLDKAAEGGRVIMEAAELEEFVADHFGDTHTLSVPRARFAALGGYPLGFKVCEDVHFLTRLCAESERVGVVCNPMAVYRIHAASATRKDPVKAQEYNVTTLLDLASRTREMPDAIRRGVSRRLAAGRLNLAYALNREGRRSRAIGAVLPSVVESPGWQSVRGLLSVLRG